VAVITGAASGIGRAVAERAATEGMKLVLADIEEASLKLTADELTASGAEVEAVPTDVSDGSDVEALRDRALERFGAVHLVHNNAGVGVGGPLWTVSETDWKWILGVNLWRPDIRALVGRPGRGTYREHGVGGRLDLARFPRAI